MDASLAVVGSCTRFKLRRSMRGDILAPTGIELFDLVFSHTSGCFSQDFVRFRAIKIPSYCIVGRTLGRTSKAGQTMNVSLPDALEEYVSKLVDGGPYTSASEVVRDGLRLLQKRDAAIEVLRAEVQEGLSGLICLKSLRNATFDVVATTGIEPV